MANQRRNLVWTDAQGESVLHVISTASGGAAIQSALEGHSNAVVATFWEGTDQETTSSPVVATYPTVRVTTQLIFSNAVGSIAKLYLPSPISSIFLSDKVTVDPLAIGPIIAAALGNLLAGDKTPVTQFVGGQLWQQKITGIASLQAFEP